MKNIYRFYADSRRPELLFLRVSDEQATEWCSHPNTRKEGKFFDGFRKELLVQQTRNSRLIPKYSNYFHPSKLIQ